MRQKSRDMKTRWERINHRGTDTSNFLLPPFGRFFYFFLSRGLDGAGNPNRPIIPVPCRSINFFLMAPICFRRRAHHRQMLRNARLSFTIFRFFNLFLTIFNYLNSINILFVKFYNSMEHFRLHFFYKKAFIYTMILKKLFNIFELI